MKILLSGGGSGGHVTPLLAVAHELKNIKPDIELAYIGERRGKFTRIATESGLITESRLIFAGKLRRYHGESFLQRVLDVKTNFLNFRDVVYTLIGILQAVWVLSRLKPDLILIKGGFVAVPVGIAARVLRIPFITHDSDTIPGLANRIIGRWARVHATGMPAEFYNYPERKMRFVGIPLSRNYVLVSESLKNKYKSDLGLPENSQVILVAGGSQGSASLNRLVAAPLSKLLQKNDNLYALHQTGKGQENLYSGLVPPPHRLRTFAFANDMYKYSGAADLIIARSGATFIAEFAAQSKACIVVPHRGSDGHQSMNAAHLARLGAVINFNEDELATNPRLLPETVERLLSDHAERRQLASNLAAVSKPNAARNLAELLLEVGSR